MESTPPSLHLPLCFVLTVDAVKLPDFAEWELWDRSSPTSSPELKKPVQLPQSISYNLNHYWLTHRFLPAPTSTAIKWDTGIILHGCLWHQNEGFDTQRQLTTEHSRLGPEHWMGKLDVFMSYSPCDLGAALSCRQCTLKSLFCGSMGDVGIFCTHYKCLWDCEINICVIQLNEKHYKIIQLK